jgi:protein-tyrosine-phosphatase
VTTLLFVCVHNAGRSQMAAAFASRLGGERVTVLSAGSAPADSINAAVVEAMAEIGVDLAHERPRLLDPAEVERADVVVTMGCGDACPVFPGVRYEDWELPDPAGRPVEEVRPIRDEIERRVRALLAGLEAAPGASTLGER